jgi:hypothetical protein
MTSTMPVPNHAQNGAGPRVSALLIPADSEQPVRRIEILSPSEGLISGDIVLIAFDEHGEERDVPAGLEDRIAATERLPTAPLMVRAGRSIVHEWEVSSNGNGSQLLATLTVGHYAAIDRRAQRCGGEFRALLANRTEEPGLFGETIHSDGPAAFCVRREDAWSFTDAQLDSFSALALARLHALYAVSDERVKSYFKAQP